MAHIAIIAPQIAEGELKRVYEEIEKARGSVAQVNQVQGLNPRALRAHLELYLALLYGEGPLSRRERELIGVITSQGNRCHYCVAHHSDALHRYLREDSAISELREGRIPESLTPREKALAQWALVLGGVPPSATDGDVRSLREAGFSDREILDATLIAAYFNFVNRIVIGLGVDMEPNEEQKYRY